MERYSKEKDKLREGEMKETKRIIAEMEDRVKEKDDRINELLERMKEAGNVNTS